MDKALAAEERMRFRTTTDPHIRQFCISWRRLIFDGSRVVFIICALVFIRESSSVINEIRLMRAELIEQQTSIRMAVQLQGREIARNLHSLDVNSTVLIDRFDAVSTHMRGQMTDAAKTVAAASKEDRRQIVKAIESNAETPKETLPLLLPEVRVVPVPEALLPPNVQPGPSEQPVVPVPQPSPVAQPPEVQRKGLWKKLWSSVTRVF